MMEHIYELWEVSDCPRSCKARNTPQNKSIPAVRPTPFLDGQIEDNSHSHEMQTAQGPECVRTELGPGTVFLELNSGIAPHGESCMDTRYSLTESQPCKYVSRISHS